MFQTVVSLIVSVSNNLDPIKLSGLALDAVDPVVTSPTDQEIVSTAILLLSLIQIKEGLFSFTMKVVKLA